MNPPAPRARTRRRRVVFALVQLVVVLVLAELAVRIVAERNRAVRTVLNASTDVTSFDDVEDLEELMGRTILGFSPGRVRYGFVLNSRSFRTAEYEPAPAPGIFRVVALGDSFTFASGGLPHSQHWTAVTEGLLRRDLDPASQVLGLGVPDTGPAFQLRLWQLEGQRLEPDVVVLAFFVGNDFVDHQPGRQALGGSTLGASGRLASVSAVYRLTRNLLRIERGAASGRGMDPTADAAEPAPPGTPLPRYDRSFDPDRPTFAQDEFVAIEARRMALCRDSNAAVFDELAESVVAVLHRLISEIEAGGARCVVMIVPDQYQVDGQLVDLVLEATGTVRDDYDFERPQRALRLGLEASGAVVLDLLPVFREESAARPLYRPRDTHWNRPGNELAARALTEVLMSLAPGEPVTVFADRFENGSLNGWTAARNRD